MEKKKNRSQQRSGNSRSGPQPSTDQQTGPDYSAEINAYIESVLSGEFPAGRLQILAVMRHLDDVKHARKRGWVFNHHIANYAIWFIQTACVHTKNSVGAKAGDPMILTPTQKFIVWSLFGWRDRAGYRRFQKAFLEVARKYGKSTFVAAILLLVLVFDWPQEPEAEIYCAATKEKQAQLVFKLACGMARKSKYLRGMLRPLARSLMYDAMDSFIQPIGSDSDGTDGLNPSVVIKDELHAWQKRHRGLHKKLETGDGARLQPLGITITTAGDENAQIWKEERAWFVRAVECVISGEIVDDRAFAFICCLDVKDWECVGCRGTGRRKPESGSRKADECGVCKGTGKLAADLPFDPKSGCDPFDQRMWTKANPNMGYSVDFSKYEKHINRALKSSLYRNTCLRYYGNVMVSSSEKLIDPLLWSRNGGKPYIHPGQYCRGAFDLGRSDDFAAWALAFPGLLDISPTSEDLEDGISALHTYDLIGKSYTCEARAESLMNPEIESWIDQGLLDVHPGDQVDFEQIENDIVEISQKYSVLSWAFDQMFAPQMAQHLINRHGLNCTRFSQSPSWYNPGIRELLRALRRGDVAHGNDPLMAWQASNVVVTRDARDLWMPDKSDPDKKIDLICAILMAISDCLFHAAEDDGKRSVYETRGSGQSKNLSDSTCAMASNALFFRSEEKIMDQEMKSAPIKWHGGKTYLAEQILEIMPKHTHYVEPFFGGGAVLFNKPLELVDGHSEVVNDVYGDLINFWKVLQSKAMFAEFHRAVSLTPFSKPTWESAKQCDSSDQLERAVAFFIRYRQSRQGLGRDFATMSRTRTRRGMNEQVSSWLSAVEGLPSAHRRLQRVAIFCEDAIGLIKKEDDESAFFYCDPPYVSETRVVRNAYQFEMTDNQHGELLQVLGNLQGKFILSGYPNKLYRSAEKRFGWNCRCIQIDNKASSQKQKPQKTECLWFNF